MRHLFMLGSLLLCLSTHTTAQTSNNDAFLEEYLEEKVRDPELRELILDMKHAQEANNATLEASVLQQMKDRLSTLRGTSNGRSETTIAGGAEPYIAINPANPNHLAATYMESGASGEYPVYYSFDAGNTWTQSSFSPITELDNQFPGEAMLGGGDPVFAFDEDGTLHMTWIYLHGFSFSAGMFYAYSSDGGINFTIPAQQSDHVIYDGNLFSADMLDRQWMDVDNSGGANDGNLYMSSVYFGGNLGAAGEVVLTKAAGATGFSLTPTLAVGVTGNESTQFGNIKVDHNGVVHLACMKFDGGSGAGDVVYTRSTDGAATFATPTVIGPATTTLPNSPNHIVHGRDNSATSLAVDGDNVYIAWTDMANSDVRGFYAYSNDGGLSWSSPVEYGVLTVGSNFYHLMPNLAADSGGVSISWYAVDKNTTMTDYYVVESADGGATLGTPALISGGQTNFGAVNTNDFYGDYNASVKHGCITYSIWSDGRTGAPVIYIAKTNTCVTGVAEYTPLNGGITIDNIYPNPTLGQAQMAFTLKEAGHVNIDLYSMDGKVAQPIASGDMSAGNHNIALNLSGTAAGNYVIKLTKEDGTFATRIVVKK